MNLLGLTWRDEGGGVHTLQAARGRVYARVVRPDEGQSQVAYGDVRILRSNGDVITHRVDGGQFSVTGRPVDAADPVLLMWEITLIALGVESLIARGARV